MATFTGFYGCCGADILYLGSEKYTKEGEKAAELTIKRHSNSSKAFEIVILSERVGQYGYKPMLRRNGFRTLSTGAGAHGDNELCLMVRTRKAGERIDGIEDDGTRTYHEKGEKAA